ncbi:uncharacterized protein [Bactrocera oleae]|uniref:uncharacterized protein n=1 Tax=Bactrocera oleae TaxID=104688 RepID=UPI00387EBF27
MESIFGSRQKSSILLANQVIGDDCEETAVSDERIFEKDSLETYSSKETDLDEDSLEINSLIEHKSSEILKNNAEERMATYLYGVHIPPKNVIQTPTPYKKSTAFIIPFGPDKPNYFCSNTNSEDNFLNNSNYTQSPKQLFENIEKLNTHNVIKNDRKHSTQSTEKDEAKDLHSFYKPMPTLQDIVRLYLSNTNKPTISYKSNSAKKRQTDLLTSEIRLHQEMHIQDGVYEKPIIEKYIGNALHTILNEGVINEQKGNCNPCDGSHPTKNSKIKWFVGTEPIETSVELYQDNTPTDFNGFVNNQSISTNITVEVSQIEVYQNSNHGFREVNRNTDCVLKWLSRRQNSMPVQIDSEIFRVIPKHMRKRIKSANGCKAQNQAFSG